MREISLKSFLKQIKIYTASRSKEELLDLIYQLAQDIPERKRSAILNIFEIGEISKEQIFNEIDHLIDEIALFQEALEDGSFYDQYDYFDEEAVILPDHCEQLRTLFEKTDQLFFDNNFKVATEAYQKLITIFGSRSQYNLPFCIDYREVNLEWDQIFTRYCYSLYHNTPIGQRPKQLIQVINRYGYLDILPSLKQLYEFDDSPLPEWDLFLKYFQKKTASTSDGKVLVYHLEAVSWLEGIQQAGEIIQQKNQPEGYLFWVEQLYQNQQWSDLGEAAQKAFLNIPYNHFREEIAGKLIEAAQHLKEKTLLFQGQRELFLTTMEKSHLENLLHEAEKQGVLDDQLNHIFQNLISREDFSWQQKDRISQLKVELLLLLNRFQEAITQVDLTQEKGWSNQHSTTALFHAIILTILTEGDPKGRIISEQLNHYTGNFYPKRSWLTEKLYQTVLQYQITDQERDEWSEMLKNVVESRLHHILSNKYRKAYNRAARTLCAYLEYLVLNEQIATAKEFYTIYYKRYIRFTAFRKELDTILRHSSALYMIR